MGGSGDGGDVVEMSVGEEGGIRAVNGEIGENIEGAVSDTVMAVGDTLEMVGTVQMGFGETEEAVTIDKASRGGEMEELGSATELVVEEALEGEIAIQADQEKDKDIQIEQDNTIEVSPLLMVSASAAITIDPDGGGGATLNTDCEKIDNDVVNKTTNASPIDISTFERSD